MGLDISTSVTGVAVVESDDASEHPRIVLIDYITFNGCKTFWEKVDHATSCLEEKFARVVPTLDALCVEESLQSFRPGFSSAATIVTLAKFNGLLSHAARRIFGLEPRYIAATTARKLCGIRVKRSADSGGKNAKEQVFDWCNAGPLSGYVWPTKKNGSPKDCARDMTDAYIIARAGLISS